MPQFNLNLTDNQYEWIRDKAHKERKSMAEVVRQSIKSKMEREDDSN